MRYKILTIILMMTISIAACDTQKPHKAEPKQQQTSQKVTQPAHKTATSPEYLFGKVKETMNSGGYTYILLQENSGDETWVAIPETPIEAGTEVMVKPGVPMNKFHSKTLNRTFDMIIFSSGIVGDSHGKKSTSMSMSGSSHASLDKHKGRRMVPMVKDIVIENPPEGAVTIASLYEDLDSVSGKAVTIKGKVVKVSPRIMGKNWIHLQDGSGSEEKLDYDITVTTMDLPDVGAVVVVKGTANTNRDFGAGYKYDIIIENASVTKTDK